MRTWGSGIVAFSIALAALALAPTATASTTATASPDAGLAALQVALYDRGLYAGSIDGLEGPKTTTAIKRFQRRAGLTPDGVPGTRTRRALGGYGRHLLGSRSLTRGAAGWDVAALQFLLAWHGFPSATIDGGLGWHTERALRRFQRWAGLQVDGVAGAQTFAALRRAPARCPIALAWPVAAPLGDTYGPRGNRFHAGIDLVASAGVPVAAAAPGRVTFAGGLRGGWGRLVIVAHAQGVRTLYAHLRAVSVRPGQDVGTGTNLGTVGSTGHATGPHLHFEVRLRGAAVDPLTGLR
jgi:murein DD-endopeptidase MepM/ murein hydrolase activator NlpD